MTSPPSPPNRRRRRIVVAVAVLVLGLGWWFSPRVEQRFVGTWQVVPVGSPSNYSPWIWILRNDGTGEILLPSRKHEAEFGWRGKDKSFSWSGPVRMPPLVLRWFYFTKRLDGTDRVYDIVNETEGSITLRSQRPGTRDEFTLHRVSE
jgi:hypothetical protein